MNIIKKDKLKSRSSVPRCSKLWDVDCRGTCVLLSLKKPLLMFNVSVKSMRYSICFQKHFRVYFINLMSGSIKVNKVVQKSWNLLYLLIWLMNWKPDLNIDLQYTFLWKNWFPCFIYFSRLVTDSINFRVLNNLRRIFGCKANTIAAHLRNAFFTG